MLIEMPWEMAETIRGITDLRHVHCVELALRINGRYIYLDGDWLKKLQTIVCDASEMEEDAKAENPDGEEDIL